MHISPGWTVVSPFINFVKLDYAAERSWQQSGHDFASLRPAARFNVCECCILEPMSLRAQTITSRNPGAAIESILIWRNG